MFLKKISITNYKLFDTEFVVDNFNIPDGINKGTGLTIIVGENGCGKTTILDSIALSMLDYKAESFNIYDFNQLDKDVNIIFNSNEEFGVKGTMPNSDFKAIEFNFNAKLRNWTQKNYLLTPVVYDQQYISNNAEKPKKGSPDLRLSVNNPFSGKRFNETDILYLDKNRLFQTKIRNI